VNKKKEPSGPEILVNIPVRLDPEKAKKTLHWNDQRGTTAEFRHLLETAESLIQPKAVYKVAAVDHVSGDEIIIDGILFSSRILRINLAKAKRVFPYIISIGKSLESRASASGDLLQQYYLEALGDMALGRARDYLSDQIKRQYRLRRLVNMSPGSLKEWPITQQKALFSLFGNTESLIGVRLTEHMLMLPRKSISGIYFSSKTEFRSCRICPRENCESRSAPFDEAFRKKYHLEEESPCAEENDAG
jgi:hypothetical protein